jgi:hypothetical protein
MVIGSTPLQGRTGEPTWRRPRVWLRSVTVMAVLAAGLVVAPSAQATAVSSAVFTGGTGTATVGGTLYAKQGSTLTLTVTTDNQAQCVDVGGFAGSQTSAAGKTSWVFTGTAPTGDGLKTYTVTAGESFNGNGVCTKQTATRTASYVLDNTAPTATASLNPAPNGAGWNKAKSPSRGQAQTPAAPASRPSTPRPTP